jgi:hypothetical protein
MKVIIAGSRKLPLRHNKIWLVADAVQKSGWAFQISEVFCGGARGIDLAGRQWAEDYGIPVRMFNADWEDLDAPICLVKKRDGGGKEYNALAGHTRNQEMADKADALILVWDGKSTGSSDMLKRAKAKGLKIYEYIVKDQPETPDEMHFRLYGDNHERQ